MKKYLLTFLFCISLAVYGQMDSHKPKIKVMILGMFHFVSNNDAIKFVKEDMLSDKRQKEIDDLNRSLAKFKPGKIFIEWTPRNQHYVDSTYEEYRKGNFKLNGNEVYQVGYKLANKLGHSTVYCMDAQGQYLFDTLISTAKKYNQYDAFEQYYNKRRAEVLLEDSLQKFLTIKKRLLEVNKKENIMASHIGNAGVITAPYLGKPGEYGGAEFMGEWYKRNIRMYSNIVRITSASDDAILIIVGAGHARIIQHFFEDNPAFEIVDPIKYLK